VSLASPLAQQTSSIAGVVRDASGGVLPGVTVEAASPALIEKVRPATTDGEGRYNIVDLRPGAYAVTLTLPGFSTFRRDGITLTVGFTATVDADLNDASVTRWRGRSSSEQSVSCGTHPISNAPDGMRTHSMSVIWGGPAETCAASTTPVAIIARRVANGCNLSTISITDSNPPRRDR
jgi:hypothetical protein